MNACYPSGLQIAYLIAFVVKDEKYHNSSLGNH